MWHGRSLIKTRGHIDSQVAGESRCCKKILRCNDCYASSQALIRNWIVSMTFVAVV